MNTTATHTKSSLWICLALILFSMLLVATDAKRIPGGPFVSVHAEIVPVFSCITVLFFVARDFRAASIVRRVGLSFLALVSAGIILIVVEIIASFCRDRFARGALFGW